MDYQEIEVEPARDAIEHSISRHSVGFVFGGTGRQLDTASGVALIWRKRRLIVTANHVFPAGAENEDFVVILPRDRPLNRSDKVVLPPKDMACVVSMPRVSLVRCDSDDLAYFEVDDKFGESSDIDFYELPPFAVCPPAGTGCLLSGYPQDLSGPISSDEGLVNLANRWSKIESLGEKERFLKGFDGDSQFLMKFRKANKGERAEGFSGGGVWFPLRQASDSRVWHAVSGLAGIQSKWFQGSALTLAVRVEILVRFLDHTISDLQE
jgi:hypothetical protein